MPAFLIVDMAVKDAERYAEYRRAAPALVARHGGEYLVRGGEVEVLEGGWKPARLVVIRFPDRKAAHAFLNDPEYLPWAKVRHDATDSNLIVVDGL